MAEPFIGEVNLYGFSFAPEHWILCNGTLISVDDNQALFSLLGVHYGGDGRTNFGVPDLRGTLPVSYGTDPRTGLTFNIGQRKGIESHSLSESEMPTHSHIATVTGNIPDPTVALYATTEKGTSETVTNGAYLSQSDTHPDAHPDDKPELFYVENPDASSLVSLGGIGTGSLPLEATASIASSGAGTSFSLIQSSQVINYCIALEGLYPSRN